MHAQLTTNKMNVWSPKWFVIQTCKLSRGCHISWLNNLLIHHLLRTRSLLTSMCLVHSWNTISEAKWILTWLLQYYRMERMTDNHGLIFGFRASPQNSTLLALPRHNDPSDKYTISHHSTLYIKWWCCPVNFWKSVILEHQDSSIQQISSWNTLITASQ